LLKNGIKRQHTKRILKNISDTHSDFKIKNISFFLTFKSMSDQKIKMNALSNQQNISSKRAENYERVRDDGWHRRLHTFDPQKLLCFVCALALCYGSFG
jgi:hypothetical protein